jgi:hypothetical protein
MQARHSGFCAYVIPNGGSFGGYVDPNRVKQGSCVANSYNQFQLAPSGDGHWRLVVWQPASVWKLKTRA